MSLRRTARRILNRGYAVLALLAGVDPRLIGADEFQRRFRRSDVLFVLAPGASVLGFDAKTWDWIARHDSVGLSSFVLHSFEPTFWLYETHATDLGLIDEFRHRPEERARVFYRGYNSPGKAREFIGNLRRFRRTGAATVRLLKDGYVSDVAVDARLEEVLAADDDVFYNYYGSVLYCLGFAVRCGYSTVVLCGVDCSQDYFFHHTPFRPANDVPGFFRAPNVLTADPKIVERMVATAGAVDSLLAARRNGGVYHLAGRGALAARVRPVTVGLS